ncbi:MAG TPA: class I SAM-dependent methyltransferase [Xanthobacteraceae bacterium]|nr:class I SAM-dependent methyltransferase [Xanthobacteraceae bacterium]
MSTIANLARSIALRIPAVQRVVSQRDNLLHEMDELRSQVRKTPTTSVLDRYVSTQPRPGSALMIFDGTWTSYIPGYGLGQTQLFDDHRIRWLEEKCGGFKGKRVLELGPLEAGHTSMIARAGAESILSIESNTTAFLKCLVVKNLLGFNANILLGDFRLYLENCTETFDFLLASGVLYHMTDPVKLLQGMARVSRSIGIWTHYYDSDVILGKEHLSKKFSKEPKKERIGTREITSYRQSYLEALDWSGFCGGSEPISYWLTRDSLLGLLEDMGFRIETGQEAKEHINGPCITLYATKK